MSTEICRSETNPRPLEKLPIELSSPLQRYIDVYKSRVTNLEDGQKRELHAQETIANAISRNNKMSDVLSSPEYEEVIDRTNALLGDCKLGVVCCIDGRLTVALMFGSSADVSKQKAAVLPTDVSPDTGNLTIDSSTVRVAVINASKKNNPNLLEIFVAHAASQSGSDDESGFASNCAAVGLIKERHLSEGKTVNPDLILANFDFLDEPVKAVERTYNSSAEIYGKPKLDKVAIRVVYDTESMGFVLNYGEKYPVFSTDLTKSYSSLIRGLATKDIRFQNPGALRYSYTNEEDYAHNEKMMLDIIELLMTNDQFIEDIEYACESGSGAELCGLNESQKRGVRYLMARNVAFQYLTGVHLEHMSQKHFDQHKEEYMSIARDDGHGMVVGGMDTHSQVFAAATSRIENAIDHIHTMAALMEHHSSPKPYILFISEGIEEYSSGHEGSIDSVTSRVDNIYKEVQKDEKIADLISRGNLIMIPVIQSSTTGRVVHVSITPLV